MRIGIVAPVPIRDQPGAMLPGMHEPLRQPITERQRQLATDGWCVIRGVLPASDIAIALDRLRLIAQHVAVYERLIPHVHRVRGVDLPGDADPLHGFDWIDNVTYLDEVLWRHVAAHPALLAIARQVLGDDVFPTNGGGVFLKPPGSPRSVPWHQDASPFRESAPDGSPCNPVLFDFWLGLTEATEEMGCLRLIPGSQRLGRLPHADRGGIHVELDPADHGFSEADVVSIPTGPGDLVVWHQDCIHGSGPNRSTRARIAVASVYHGHAEERVLRQRHRQGALRRRPQLCAGGTILPLPDPVAPPWLSAGEI